MGSKSESMAIDNESVFTSTLTRIQGMKMVRKYDPFFCQNPEERSISIGNEMFCDYFMAGKRGVRHPYTANLIQLAVVNGYSGTARKSGNDVVSAYLEEGEEKAKS